MSQNLFLFNRAALNELFSSCQRSRVYFRLNYPTQSVSGIKRNKFLLLYANDPLNNAGNTATIPVSLLYEMQMQMQMQMHCFGKRASVKCRRLLKSKGSRLSQVIIQDIICYFQYPFLLFKSKPRY